MTNPFDDAWQEPAKPAAEPTPTQRATNPVALIDRPGIYDLAAEVYHADPVAMPSCSASIGGALITGRPIHAWTAHPRLNPAYERTEKTQFDLGSVSHALMLGKGRDIAVIDAKDWRTKAAGEQRDAAILAHRQPVLAHVYEQALAITRAGRLQLDNHDTDGDAFTAGKPEQAIIAQVNGVWCRSMCDWLHDDMLTIDDYKTTGLDAGADPANFVRGILKRAGDIQDPFYSKMLEAIHGTPWQDIRFRFIVQETSPPYALSVIVLDSQSREFAAARADYAIGMFGDCLASGKWPGWHPRTYYGQIPAWAQVQWEERLQGDALLAALQEEGR